MVLKISSKNHLQVILYKGTLLAYKAFFWIYVYKNFLPYFHVYLKYLPLIFKHSIKKKLVQFSFPREINVQLSQGQFSCNPPQEQCCVIMFFTRWQSTWVDTFRYEMPVPSIKSFETKIRKVPKVPQWCMHAIHLVS